MFRALGISEQLLCSRLISPTRRSRWKHSFDQAAAAQVFADSGDWRRRGRRWKRAQSFGLCCSDGSLCYRVHGGCGGAFVPASLRSDAASAAVLRVCSAPLLQRGARCSAVQCLMFSARRAVVHVHFILSRVVWFQNGAPRRGTSRTSEWIAHVAHKWAARTTDIQIGHSNQHELINWSGAFMSRVIIAPIICLFGVLFFFSLTVLAP